jgi:hypothetical protein
MLFFQAQGLLEDQNPSIFSLEKINSHLKFKHALIYGVNPIIMITLKIKISIIHTNYLLKAMIFY